MESTGDTYGVGRLAELAGVSVRTLHHYDRIGLLRASERTEAGYRRYGPRDVERLHRVLSYRELGIPLDQIATLLDEPGADPITHLRRQERLLGDRISRLQEMRAATRTMMEVHEMNENLTPEERFELFGDFDPAVYEKEAEQRWGGTDAYEQSRKRVRSYGKEQWVRIQDEGASIEGDLVLAMSDDVDAREIRAMDLAEAHRRHISRWFYECSPEVHAGLGEMYVADPRFTAHYEERAEGLAAYVRDAIAANGERQAASAG